MFKFSFFSQNENAAAQVEEKTTSKCENEEDIKWSPSEEILVEETPILNEILSHDEVNVFKCEDCPDILYSSINLIIDVVKEKKLQNSVLTAEQNHSDLMPAIYEGGLKIWECTYDLVKFILSENVELKGKRVLDLGCGVGIIGILCALNKSEVYFQDYNREVIQYVTIPNLLLNMNKKFDNETLTNCKFFCGDWESFSDLVASKKIKFDYIFTSETIYNTTNYEKLHGVFKNCLNENGMVYLAAKTYYFGVGGGLRSFEDYVSKEDFFQSTICWKANSGMQREILKLTLKPHLCT